MSKRVGLQTTIIVAMLSMIGPFTIDSVFPAFARIGVQFGASDAALQQITSIYLFSYAFASLFHGPISDSVGRKPVMVAGMAAFLPRFRRVRRIPGGKRARCVHHAARSACRWPAASPSAY